jgi:hypothetical protein
VQAHNNVPFYQNLLISKANANPYYLAELFSNQKKINYDDKKPNHEALSKGTSNPVLTAIVFSFCTKVVAQETTKKSLLKTTFNF